MAATIRILVASDGGGMGKLKSDLSDLGSNAKNAGGGFSALKEVATGALRAVGAGLVDVAVKGGAMLLDFAKTSITAAGDFEGAVNGFAAVTGNALTKAGFDFDDVKEKALQLGAETAFSAQQAMEAMTELSKGGVPVVDVMGEATDATLALAAAAQLDLAPAAEIVAKQLGVWGETGIEAQQVADLLASAANASTVDVENLALGLANAGGTAKTAGVSFQDLVQTMALIAPNFSSAADAGTSLKTFISRLIPTTDKATDTMIALGLATEDGKSKFFDAQGSFIGMEAAARMLQAATADLGEEEKLTAFNTIFGSDAIRAAAAIANAGADGFNAMGQSMTDAGGAAAAAAIQNQGFNFALEQMKGSMETLQIVVGSALLPILTSLLNDYITPGINTVMTFAQAVMGSDEAFNSLSPTLQALVTVVDAVVQGFNEGGLLGAINQLIPGASGVTQVISQVVASFQQGGTASTFLATLWSGTLKPAIDAVWTVIQNQVIPIISNLAMTILPILGAALQVGASFWSNILQPAIEKIWAFFSGSILPILNEVSIWLRDNVPPAVQTLADFLSNTLFPALNTIWSFISANVLPILDSLVTLGLAVVSKAVEALAGLWQNVLKPALETVWSFLQDNVGPILKDFIGWLGDVTGGVDGVAGALKTAKSWIDSVASAIANLSLPDWLTPGSPTPWEIGLRGIADALKTGVNPGLRNMGSILGGINSVVPSIGFSGAATAGGGGGGTINNSGGNKNVTLNYNVKITGRASRSAQKDYGVMSALVKGGVFSV